MVDCPSFDFYLWISLYEIVVYQCSIERKRTFAVNPLYCNRKQDLSMVSCTYAYNFYNNNIWAAGLFTCVLALAYMRMQYFVPFLNVTPSQTSQRKFNTFEVPYEFVFIGLFYFFFSLSSSSSSPSLYWNCQRICIIVVWIVFSFICHLQIDVE